MVKYLKLILSTVFLISLPSTYQADAPSTSQFFTFAQSKSFIRVEPDWPLPKIRNVTFEFRTENPHGLLMYHGVMPAPGEEAFPYELYVVLVHGRLKVIHLYHVEGLEESFFVGKGLNRDKLHEVIIEIVPNVGKMVVYIDRRRVDIILSSVLKNKNYNIRSSIPTSFLYFGGMYTNTPIWNQKYRFKQFIGCIGNIKFSHSFGSLAHVIIQNSSFVERGCVDRCLERNHCYHGGACINHYKSTSCDCFTTHYEGEDCQKKDLTTVTLRGYSYFTHRVHDWADRAHSDMNRIGITFRSFVSDAVLLYGVGEKPQHNYIAVSIINELLHLEIDFGDGPLNCTFGVKLKDEQWHNLTIIHHGRLIHIILDSKESQTLKITGYHHHLHLDPELFIGGAPKSAIGIKINAKFVGCLRSLYFNRKNILHAFSQDDIAVRHHGIFPAEFGCSLVDVLPITFPSEESSIFLYQPNKKVLYLSFEFKTTQVSCVLASGITKRGKGKGEGFWQVSLKKGLPVFTVMAEVVQTLNLKLSENKYLSDDKWHQIQVILGKGQAKMEVDYRFHESASYPSIEFTGELLLGRSLRNSSKGFIGCMRDIFVGETWVDPRMIIGTDLAKGKVSMDNCQLVDPCHNPLACEHGGRCRVEKEETKCDCTGTGYTGKTCHFSIYKRTCEELYLVGYRESGVYKIDIDRNGPLPPAHVNCEMGRKNDAIITRVENNMQPEMVVRKPGMNGFYIDISYREFTSQMIQSLIHHSKQCFQHIKYECYIMPVGLRSYTWMLSSADVHYITSIGSKIAGNCKCGDKRACSNASLPCNCDKIDPRWRVDEGTFTDPADVGITRIYVLQPPITALDSEARLSLGPVECIETDTQQYVITFRTPYSYLEVPGWRRGDLAFSFRTSNTKAVLIHQAAVHAKYGYFRVLLTSEHELSFEFIVNGKPHIIKVMSRRKLNSGEWQQVWVDYDIHHMRFTVNLDSEMIDLGEEEEVGHFEGPLYVGGVPKYHGDEVKITEGFIGCFRGLIMNGALVNLYKYFDGSSPHVEVGCEPSCSPNPCKNGAFCQEFWGYYQCQCANLLAHSGKDCEKNINTNAVTFVTQGSYYHQIFEGDAINSILVENILLNIRTYSKTSLLLYAFDYLNNFVQLHLDNEKIVFTFNSNATIAQGSIYIPGIAQGQSVQIHVQRSKENTTFYVNNQNEIISSTLQLLETYDDNPWKESEIEESVKPRRGPFSTLPHSELFLGDIERHSFLTELPGFVGCLRGLKIGNTLFDLQVTFKNDSVYGNLLSGCAMLCDSLPCDHGGLCLENWGNNLTSCDCSLTSYTGNTCQKDIGGNFDGKSIVTYFFSTQTVSSSALTAKLAFSTDVKLSTKVVLLYVKLSENFNDLLIGLLPEGGLFIKESGEVTGTANKTITNQNFTDGYRHWIFYKRIGKEVTVMVDDVEYTVDIHPLDSMPSQKTYDSLITVGGLKSKDSMFEGYGYFKGCISSVEVQLNNENIQPLEVAFGYQKGVLNVKVDGAVNEQKCAEFTTMFSSTETPLISAEVQGPAWLPEPPVKIPYKSPSIPWKGTHLQQVKTTSGRVAVGMGLLLIFVLIILTIYVYKLQKRHQRRLLNDDLTFFKGKRRYKPTKVVSIAAFEQNVSESHPLHEAPDLADLRTKSYVTNAGSMYQDPEYSPSYHRDDDDSSDVIEMTALRPQSSSEELEWDPAVDNAELITTSFSNEHDADEREDTSYTSPKPDHTSPILTKDRDDHSRHSSNILNNFGNRPVSYLPSVVSKVPPILPKKYQRC